MLTWRGVGDWDFEDGLAAWGALEVAEFEGAAVGFGDLAREGETDSSAGFLGGVEGDEEVVGIGEAGAVVGDGDGEESGAGFGLNGDGGREGDSSWAGQSPRGHGLGDGCLARAEGGFNRVADKVDEELFELIGVCEDLSLRDWMERDFQPRFEAGDSLEQGLQGDAAERGGGELRELAVGLDEAMEGLGATLDDFEAAVEVGE